MSITTDLLHKVADLFHAIADEVDKAEQASPPAPARAPEPVTAAPAEVPSAPAAGGEVNTPPPVFDVGTPSATLPQTPPPEASDG